MTKSDDAATARRDELSALLGRVAQGDRRALALVYEMTSAKLFGVCLRISRDRDAAEDILQDIYVKVWRRADHFNCDRASPITWLCAIARNTSIDWVRKHGASRLGLIEATERLGMDICSPLEVVMADANRAKIFDCLEALPANQRRAIQLAFYEGTSHSELAEIMQVPLGTTKSWIRRGLNRLRGCLQDE